MNSETPWKSLTLVLSGLVMGMLAFQAAPSVAQDAPAAACARWEVTQWSPTEDGDCEFKGKSPYSHRGEWCKAPEGADVIDAIAVPMGEASGDTFRFWVKRCVQR